MNALSGPIVIGLMIFNIVMIVGYFSSRWQDKYKQDRQKGDV
jgi:hypothetical protein